MSKQTKPPMTAQQVFDKVLAGMRQQGAPSYYLDSKGNPGCRYRSTIDGVVRKCAAGLLLDDALYDPEFEGTAVDVHETGEASGGEERMLENAMIGSGVPRECLRLVRDMQGEHDVLAYDLVWGHIEDQDFLPEFEVRMMKIASADGLEYTQPTSSNKETCHD